MATDAQGYLLDPAQRTPAIAELTGVREDIVLGPDHWEMIRFVRDGYKDREVVPEARRLRKAMRQGSGEDKGTGRYLHGLFPHGDGPEPCKIVGMTLPRKVMLAV